MNDPHDARAHIALARSLLQQDKPAEAVPVLQRLLKVEPDFAPGYMLLGMAMRHLGRSQDAIKHFRHALELNPLMPEPAMQIASMYDPQFEPDQALHWCDEALSRDPENAARYPENRSSTSCSGAPTMPIKLCANCRNKTK